MTTAAYVHADTDFESERSRLRLLEARYDRGTMRRIGAAFGSLKGARCVEVGAGAGSVVRWLADRVGDDGCVVATDLDPRFLTGLDEPNVEVRRHDILVDDLEEGAFDLVHCRALLLHLADPGQALNRMFRALRPGGLLLVEDADFVSLAATDPGHRLSGPFDQITRALLTGASLGGRFDPWFGRRLVGLVTSLGVEADGYEATVAIRRGGSPEAELHRQSFGRGRESTPAESQVTDCDLDVLSEAMTDPSFTFFDAVSVAAWGRRPV